MFGQIPGGDVRSDSVGIETANDLSPVVGVIMRRSRLFIRISKGGYNFISIIEMANTSYSLCIWPKNTFATTFFRFNISFNIASF